MEMLENAMKNLKFISQLQSASVNIYKLVEQSEQSISGFGNFLECQKYNILVITQALMLCLIYTHLPLGAACPLMLCIDIRQSTLACVITYAYNYVYINVHMVHINY